MLRQFIAATAFMTAFAPAAANEEIHGRVHGRDGSTVEVCFDRDFTAASGEEFLIIRHTLSGPPKSVPALHSETIGSARITSLRDDGCAQATLLHGSAHAFDWVAPAATS
jgi:hypothetical protein